jgi:methenyltetrahydromethanopterin cyclohydrolase
VNDRLGLNERALQVVARLVAHATEWNVVCSTLDGGGNLIDAGIQARGGLEAGLALARVCLSDLAQVDLVPGDVDGRPCPLVQVRTDSPVLACMASQYAGWRIQVGEFFALGSGPMRAVLGVEPLFETLPGKERPNVAVGVLETSRLPTPDVAHYLADRLGIAAASLTLLAARTASLAGIVQVVARSVETALHKLHELGFDLSRIYSGYGIAPLPPVARTDLAAMGRTNDAILYGGRVILWVDADDAELATLGPRVPSSSSRDHGAPFAEIFERSGRDFYRVDPLLFSPAVVTFHNLRSGRCHVFGRVEPDVLRRSFFLE